MESIRELYRIGHGPSSSHTMGPRRAAESYRDRFPDATAFRVTLFGSLAATGRGHLTDAALREALAPHRLELDWRPQEQLPLHPNGMRFELIDGGGRPRDAWEVYSVGGGALAEAGHAPRSAARVYEAVSMAEVLDACEEHGIAVWQYVAAREGEEIWGFLGEVWRAMAAAIDRGLRAEGTLPGGLGLGRKAAGIRARAASRPMDAKRDALLSAYALAVSEENAAGGRIVTAPTCGSCGIVPAVLRTLHETLSGDEAAILRALATAGLIGNLVKRNASISGAEVGCQGEVGTACAMAAGAAAQLLGGSPRQIEYAAEMALEHHLGLTCDPVAGLVQIPCIERNAFAATRAVSAAEYALLSDGTHRISFDDVVAAMRQTGHDLPRLYRETATGGLAVVFRGPKGE